MLPLPACSGVAGTAGPGLGAPLESYIVRIYRRSTNGAPDRITGTVEDPVSGERASFRSVAGLMRWLGHAPRAKEAPSSRPGPKKRKGP
jgi:hypothetical protein